jgi:hypothetical protein
VNCSRCPHETVVISRYWHQNSVTAQAEMTHMLNRTLVGSSNIPSEFRYRLRVYLLLNVQNPELVRGVPQHIRLTHSTIWSGSYKHAKKHWTENEKVRGVSTWNLETRSIFMTSTITTSPSVG